MVSKVSKPPHMSPVLAVKDGFAKKLTLFDESAAAGLSLTTLETQNGKQGIKTATHVAGFDGVDGCSLVCFVVGSAERSDGYF